MGSFSQIIFADYPVFDNKNWYYPEIIKSLFLPDDFIIEKRKYSTRNSLVWGDAYENEKGTFEFKGYKQTVEVCRERLEIFGASYKKAKLDFQKAKKISRHEGFYDFSLSSIATKILRYPDITLAKKYPTLGPTGKKNMNVNGLACSIEMYFGVDVLTRNNELIPIQWKGFDDKEKKYQGEIADKNYVQDTFRNKLKKPEMNEIKELTELLNGIFKAYK